MKTKFISVRIACASAMLFTSSALYAQQDPKGVKIGARPTEIEATSALEVEAAGPGEHKVKVHNNSGQLTVKDGTEGKGRVFTSDEKGGGSWQPSVSSMASVKSSVAQYFTPDTKTIINYGTTVFDRGGNFNLATNEYTVPSDGVYFVKAATTFDLIDQTNQVFLLLYKNGQEFESLYLNPAVPQKTAAYAVGFSIVFLKAGEKLQTRVQSNRGGYISASSVSYTRMSN